MHTIAVMSEQQGGRLSGVHDAIALSHPKYRPDIDGLRAIAVLSVVGFHAFPDWIKGGFVGVDIFFVISGFLISTIIFENLERQSFDFIEFYSRRIRRIFPALLLVLIGSYVFGWFTLLGDEYKQLGKHIAGGAGFVSNFVLWNESGYFNTAAETKPLLHLWSLGIEEQFYIVWPLLLWAGWTWRLNLLSITILVATASLIWNVWEVSADAVATFYSPQTRFWELLTGSTLAWATLHRQRAISAFMHSIDGTLGSIIFSQAPKVDGSALRNTQSLLGAALVVASLILITKERQFPGWWAILPTLGAVLMISAGPSAWINRAVLSSRALVWFGLISFPLYLWHWPLLSFARIAEGQAPTAQLRIAAVVIATALAWLTYKVIEKPMRFGRRSNAKALVLAALMTVVGYLGYNVYLRDGLAFRIPREFSDADFEYHKNIRANICHIETTDVSVINPLCIEKTRPLLAVWGDSHASALYPGLRMLKADRPLGIIQLTAAACPPIFGLDELSYKKDCNANNENVFRILQAEKPDVLVLHAAWMIGVYPMTMDRLKLKFERTLKRIKAGMPGTKLIVIGPVPRWVDSPRKVAFLRWKKGTLKTGSLSTVEIAERLDDLDKLLREIATESNARYISAIGYLCTDRGCISKVGDGPLDWIAVDPWHLSKNGAEYFVGQFKDQIFDDIKVGAQNREGSVR